MLARALIVLLLILNLGVALWWTTRHDAPAVAEVALPPGSERLQLLREAPTTAPVAATPEPPAPSGEAGALPAPGDAATPATAPETVAAAVPAPVVEATCRAFGPFVDVAARDRARALLQPASRRLALRETRTAAARGWRVFLSGLADRDAANAMATRLTAAGFRDHYVLPAPAAGAVEIALGRFGGEAAAVRHQAALRTAGFEARAEPIGEADGTRYWIDVETGADFDVVGLRRASGAAQAETIACTALAASGR
ncbi:MAG: hypothetical protein LCH70_15310 [Proteobacteria bacterium]|nr:hypothetical protein [Pseudomonadota bacterium]